jgi:hypothetical protein
MVPFIFKDHQMQSLFDKQGFVIVDFLPDSDVKELDRLFDELHPSLPGGGFVSGSYSNDLEYKKKASEHIVSVFSSHYERIFQDYQPFGAAFLYKLPSENSELGIHQDWTIVDEEKYVALNCWIPLTDINEHNGALHVLPGSHYPNNPTLRAPTIPFFFRGNEADMIESAIPIYVKAGQAVILNQSVIHYSPSNRSGKIRKAITAGVKTQDAPMIFHYKAVEDKVERFEMPEDFLLRFENFATGIFERPALGAHTSTIEYRDPVMDKKALGEKIRSLKAGAGFGVPSRSFLSRLVSKLRQA